jgi:hypothetical protein
MVAAIGNGIAFARGRDFAAWLGLVPKQMSTGDRTILKTWQPTQLGADHRCRDFPDPCSGKRPSGSDGRDLISNAEPLRVLPS